MKPGDLLLDVQLSEEGAGGDVARLVRFERVEDVVRCFQENGAYEGKKFEAWIWRKGEIRTVGNPDVPLVIDADARVPHTVADRVVVDSLKTNWQINRPRTLQRASWR